jgi:hypothetical protein
MRFCQTDGTPLVDDEPAFDPYATIMAKPGDLAPQAPAEATAEAAAEEVVLEPLAGIPSEPAAGPISEPEEVLDLPEKSDPLKTMYVSEAEMQAAFGSAEADQKANEPPQPEQPSFSVPDIPPPSFGDVAPPPSPFSVSQPEPEPESPAAPMFDEAPTAVHSSGSPFDQPTPFEPASPFDPTPPAPVAEWTPPPAPDAAWQNKPIGSNTPFEPPPVGAGGPSQGLAVGALVCGILSCLCCLSIFTGPAGIVMGYMAKKKADEDPAQYGGRGMALGGMIAGIAGTLLGITLIILQIFFGVLGSVMR